MMINTTLHGGDLDIISRMYNINKNEIINFSGNVNPLGLPNSIPRSIEKNLYMLTEYPDVAYLSLRESISSYTNIDKDHIVVGNGSTELISLFIKAVSPKKAVIVSPAYSEYQKEIELVGGKIELFPLKEEENFILNTDALLSSLNESIDMVVICNPNNPTGTYVDNDQAKQILDKCLEYNIYVMFDETYVEFADRERQVSAMPLIEKYNNLCIIRGTSKFFSCPGLRLGYGACSDSRILDYIKDNKDPWSVNILAQISGEVMFKDTEFIEKTISFISSEREKIKDYLKNLYVFKSQANFFLVKILKEDLTSDIVFEECIKEKMLIRNASNFPYLNNKYIRFCILDSENNSRLLHKLNELSQ